MFLTRRFLAFGTVVFLAAAGIALAETAPPHQGMMGSPEMREMMQKLHPEGMTPMAGHPGMQAGLTAPTMPGQDAFGAIQEIVRMLDADPKTDWSKLDLEALRQHLVDMSEVTLKADAAAKPIDGGLEIAVTGRDRTLAGSADGPGACPGNQWPEGLERQDRAASERRVSHGDRY
jgi:hypothetical protein